VSPPPGICHPRKEILNSGGKPGKGEGGWVQLELTDALKDT